MSEKPDLATLIANLLAHRRTAGSVFMDGSHNPNPAEVKGGKRIAELWDDTQSARISELEAEVERLRNENAIYQRSIFTEPTDAKTIDRYQELVGRLVESEISEEAKDPTP